MAKPFRDVLDPKSGPKKSQPSHRGRAIAGHREKHGDQTDWSAVFKKLDRQKKTSKG